MKAVDGAALPDAARLAALGREVVEREADALHLLAAQLDDRFAETVRRLGEALTRGGRLLVTGMGKSGLVARKVASTLCSTGAPAIFVHPSEAAHGDLGLMTRDDVLIALSRSGDLEVLGAVISAAERLEIPVIAWTTVADSPLARVADLAIVLEVGPEADPDDLIPSASSTAMMALGDATAIALYRGRGLDAEDFARLNPAGNLGRRLTLRVKDLMRAGDDMPGVPGSTTLLDALPVISSKGLGTVVIPDADGKLAGVLTDGDVHRALQDDPESLSRPVVDLMTSDPRTIGPDELVARAIQRMEVPARRITTLVVVDDERRPVGVLHLHDCLQAGLR